MSEIRQITLKVWNGMRRWFDTHAETNLSSDQDSRAMDLIRTLPFLVLHASVLMVFWVGWSWVAVLMAVLLYATRMFAITGFYHRYFSHKTFRTSRSMQFVFAVFGASAVQRGPLWWASNHRTHHACSDQPTDVHSPVHHGFWWSHLGWVLSHQQGTTNLKKIRDFARFPELRFLDRFDVLVPFVLAVSLFVFGEWLESAYPYLETNGLQMLVWGFVISTVALYHGTFTINSLSHLFGTRPYPTSDNSRNNFLLALLTLGEGWHNNHHHYPSSTRQGFRWWELDITYYLLRGFQFCGLIWDIRPVPRWALEQTTLNQANQGSSTEKIAV